MSASAGAADGLRLRRLRWWDVPTLLPVEQASFGADAWSEAAFWSELAGWPGSRCYLVAEQPDGRLVGYAGLLTVADEASVQTVAVDPDERRRGVGRRLVEGLLEAAAARGAATVWLEVRHDNEAALALYASYGFTRTGVRRGYYEAGRVDAVVMRRRPGRGAGDGGDPSGREDGR